jgi:hypothetical protein
MSLCLLGRMSTVWFCCRELTYSYFFVCFLILFLFKVGIWQNSCLMSLLTVLLQGKTFITDPMKKIVLGLSWASVFFFSFMILLAYASNTGGYIEIFTYVFKIYLSWIYPFNHSPSSSLSPFLRTISTGLILPFSCMDTKYIHHIHPYSPFPCVHPPPTGPHLWKRPIFPLSLHFLKVYIDNPRGFALVFQACIYHALIKLTPLLCYLLFLYHHAPIIFSSLQYSALYYIHI